MQQNVQGSLTFVRVQALGRSLFRLLDSDCDGAVDEEARGFAMTGPILTVRTAKQTA